jgi:predicted XRE-type DNA-binding protein
MPGETTDSPRREERIILPDPDRLRLRDLSVGPGVYEIRIHAHDAYRVFFVAKFEEAVYVLHAFQKKTQRRQGATSRLAGSVTARSKTGAARVRKLEEIKFIQGSDNVFEDLGFDREEAANLKIRADLMIDLREYIRARGWTQAAAADFFGETQPRISNLMKGEISRFSIDKLINMLARAGLQVRLETKPRAA